VAENERLATRWARAILFVAAVAFAVYKATGISEKQNAETQARAASTAPAVPRAPTARPTPLPTPAEDPKVEVTGFYDNIIARRYDAAYDRLSPSFKQTMSHDVFVHGFETTTSLRYSILGETGPDVRLTFTSFDSKKPGIESVFTGHWKLVPRQDGSRWLLDEGILRGVDYALSTPAPMQTTESVVPSEDLPPQYTTPSPEYDPVQPPAPVAASTCEDETIGEVERDGKVITTIEGSVYLVNDIDTATTAIWLGTDDIKACSDDDRHYRLIDGSDVVSATKVQ